MYEIFDKLLKERDITAYRVSVDTGVSQSSLSDWKTGKSKPKYENMKKIADYFGVSVEYLNGEADEKNEKPALTHEDELSDYDWRILKWFRSLPPEKRQAIVSLGDGPVEPDDPDSPSSNM